MKIIGSSQTEIYPNGILLGNTGVASNASQIKIISSSAAARLDLVYKGASSVTISSDTNSADVQLILGLAATTSTLREIEVTGTATDLDLTLTPKGSGHVAVRAGYETGVTADDLVTSQWVQDQSYGSGDGIVASLTTTGTSGVATLITGVLNIPNYTYTLPEATATVRGGIELFSNTDNAIAANAVSDVDARTYGIQLNTAGQGVVNVPWSSGGAGTVGGTGTDNQVAIWNGTANINALTAGTNTEVLTMVAGIPAWADPISSVLKRVNLRTADSTTSFGSLTHAAISWNATADFIDTDVFTHSTVTNPSRLEVEEDGVYTLKATIGWTTNQTGNRMTMEAFFKVNGITTYPSSTNRTYNRGTTYGNSTTEIHAEISLSANDYVEVFFGVDIYSAAYTCNVRISESEFTARKATATAVGNTWRPQANISDLTDVTITTIATGELLKWNGAIWINNTLAEAGISATSHNHTGVYLQDSAGTVSGITLTDNGTTVTLGGAISTLNQNTTGTAAALTTAGTIDIIGDVTGTAQTYTSGGNVVFTAIVGNDTHTHGAANLTGTTLASGVVTSSLTTVGIIGSGTWQGTAINQTYLIGQSGTNTGDEILATATVAGIVELFSNTDNPTAANAVTSTASRTYGVQLNTANQMVVNVPWIEGGGTGDVTAGTQANEQVAVWNATAKQIEGTSGLTYNGSLLSVGSVTASAIITAANYKMTNVPGDTTFSTSRILVRDTNGNFELLVAAGTSTGRFLKDDGTWAAAGGGTTDITITHAATTVTVNSSTGTNGVINGATISLAGVVTNGAQTWNGIKTFDDATTFVGGLTTSNKGIGIDVTSRVWGTYSALEVEAHGAVYGSSDSTTGEVGITYNAYYNTGWKYKQTTNLDQAARFVLQDGAFKWYSTSTAGKYNTAITFIEEMRLSLGGQLDVNGNVVSSSTVVSDARLKHKIEHISSKVALELLLGLDSVTYSYNYRRDGLIHTGYLAHEFEKYLPNAILKTDILGAPEIEGLYSTISYVEVIPYITEAMKEHNRLIKESQEEIVSLKKNYKVLRYEFNKYKKKWQA